FTRLQLFFRYMSAGMHKRQPVTFQLLHDKSFASKKAGAQFFLKFYSHRYALGGAEKRILLANHLAAKPVQVERNDLAGIGRSKTDLLFPLSGIGESRHKQAFTGQYPFPRRHEFA